MTTKPWYLQRTFYFGLGTFITAMGGFISGEVSWGVTLPLLNTAVMGIFLRQGMETSIVKPMLKQKTTKAGIFGALSAVASVATGAIAWPVALPTVAASLIGVFLRQGVNKEIK